MVCRNCSLSSEVPTFSQSKTKLTKHLLNSTEQKQKERESRSELASHMHRYS